MESLRDHIASGSTLIHDMENSHKVLIVRLSLIDEPHNAQLLKGIPDANNALEPVNRLCCMVGFMLRDHSGFNRDDLQGYLDLLSVALNLPTEKLEKVAMVLDRAMCCHIALRFRNHFHVQSSSVR